MKSLVVFDEAILAKKPHVMFSVRLSTDGYVINNLLVKIILITYTVTVSHI